ncbi:MFS transporter [Seongchinamella sediminis]|uniref:MFS transporter n=1 Tax=Seongchinamella sediminis TaxID=2283635 RepID=A0A3L7DWZ7_9GAMM|nr:MFS transporter [Seongchinamella sediminis]RLQ21110.1 MFS transporter [Seongchinamella sediminis]
MSRSGEAPQQQAPGEPTSVYSYYVLVLLSIVYIFNFIDRQIMAVLIDPIKAEFGVSDTAMGFLSGFAFVFFYTLVGIPIARWADRGSRRFIITVAIALWSLMTAASGLARSFTQLAIIRVLVGVGEAGATPPSHSLLSDYFPLEKRATALAIYSWGVYIGAALAFPIGGYLVEHYGWRTAFYAVGLPGVALSLLVWFTVREVPRGSAESNEVNIEHASLGEVLRFLVSRRSFMLIVLGSALQSLSGFGVITWGAPFLSRVHGMNWSEIGITMGWIIAVAGCSGVFLGGRLADRLGGRDQAWYMRLPALESFLCIPFIAAFALITDTRLAILSFIPFYFLGAAYVGPMHAMVQSLVRVRMRATASAILLFVVNMVGAGLGPLVVGLLNDYVFGPLYGEQAIRYSILVIGLVGGLASLLFWQASKTLAADLARRDED